MSVKENRHPGDFSFPFAYSIIFFILYDNADCSGTLGLRHKGSPGGW